MKLIKQKNSEWHGNGFGSASAEWLIAGTNITVSQLGMFWYAVCDGKKIARGATKNDLLENIKLKSIA